jgi:hypothetical protein
MCSLKKTVMFDQEFERRRIALDLTKRDTGKDAMNDNYSSLRIS